MDLKNCDGVTTVCYGKVQEWESRSEAKNHFLDAMQNSDGSERERYSIVYLKMVLGYSYCTDDIDDGTFFKKQLFDSGETPISAAVGGCNKVAGGERIDIRKRRKSLDFFVSNAHFRAFVRAALKPDIKDKER